MASLPGLRPVAMVTLQVGGVSFRAGLACESEGFAPGAVESFVLLLHRCTRCMFTCTERGDMTSHLSSSHLSPAHLSPAHMISTSQEFMQTDKEDEDLFLYDMFDISAQGAELQESHTCQVNSLFEEHCSLFKEETDQSAHLRTLGLCPAPKSPPTTPPKASSRTSGRTGPEAPEESSGRSRVRPRSSRTSSGPPRVRAESTAQRPAHRCRTKSREQAEKRVKRDDRTKIHRKHLQKEKNFCCSVCNRSFSSALTLRRHAGVHSDLRPFRCSFCTFSSRLRASVQQHQRTHTGSTTLLVFCKVHVLRGSICSCSQGKDLSGVPFAPTPPSTAALCSDTSVCTATSVLTAAPCVATAASRRRVLTCTCCDTTLWIYTHEHPGPMDI